jgi:hypothetical protein
MANPKGLSLYTNQDRSFYSCALLNSWLNVLFCVCVCVCVSLTASRYAMVEFFTPEAARAAVERLNNRHALLTFSLSLSPFVCPRENVSKSLGMHM